MANQNLYVDCKCFSSNLFQILETSKGISNFLRKKQWNPKLTEKKTP